MSHPVQRFFEDITSRWYVWVLLFVVALALPLARSITRDLPPSAPILATLPDFDLVNQDGHAFTPEDMLGHVNIVNFIFTSCGAVCPRLSAQMRTLQERLDNMGDSVHLVSFSVDPDRDTPEKLRAYAANLTARHDIWSFVTGPIEEIEATVVEGFKIGMERLEVDDTGFFDIVHGERFVVVDQLGNIRGYYSADEEGLQQILNQAGLLANLGPRIADAASTLP